MKTARALMAKHLGLMLVLGSLINVSASASSLRPYIQDKKGQKPFPENVAAVKDKDWLAIGYPEFAGGFRPRLGVVLSEDGDAVSQIPDNPLLRDLYLLSKHDGGGAAAEVPAKHVEEMVRQALGATGRFTMLERTTAADDVIAEQDAGASGRMDRKTAPAIGKIKGADYIVKATIIELNPDKDAKEIKVGAGGLAGGALGIGSVGISGKVAFCRLNVRLVNATTGEIVQDMTVDGTANESSVDVGAFALKAVPGGIFGGGGKAESKKGVVISNAIQACANKVAYHTAMKLESLPWIGSVVSADPLAVNAGTNVGLVAGLELNLYAKGAELLDDDGSSLGFTKKLIGRVRIVDVQERFSTCEVLEGCGGAKKGDIVQLDGTDQANS